MSGSIRPVPAGCLLLAAIFPAVPAGAIDPLITPGAELVEVYSGPDFFEGPSWDPATEKLYFSGLTSNSIYCLTPPNTVALWMSGTQGINGTYLSHEVWPAWPRLLCAQQNAKRILSLGIGLDGPEDPATLAENPVWNAPNDICQTPTSPHHIYFTTPDFATRTTSKVYHLSPGGVVTPVVTDMTLCNGVITSLDGQTLYVSDSWEKWWRSYPINPDGTVGAGSLFFNPNTSNMSDPDGMTIDELGNLYFNGRGGLWIVSPTGQQLEMLEIPGGEFNTNATFGGVDGKTLYVTCDQKVYSLSMQVRGGRWHGVPEEDVPPDVDAGVDQTITSRTDSVQLDATVTDDGLPDPPGEVTTAWSKLSGPGSVEFDDEHAVDTTATFSEVGAYVLQLLAFDGMRIARDEATITVLRVADFNGDGDVDRDDLGQFFQCRTGANLGPPAPGCELVDIDTDGDVDMSDFGLFQRCLSGTGQLSDPDCAD